MGSVLSPTWCTLSSGDVDVDVEDIVFIRIPSWETGHVSKHRTDGLACCPSTLVQPLM